MADYYRPWTGKIQVAGYELLNPQVVVDGDMALLTCNLVNDVVDGAGVETTGSHWNSTTVLQRRGRVWITIHSTGPSRAIQPSKR